MKHFWLIIWQLLIEFFFQIPDIVALVFAAIALAVAVMGEQVKKLGNYPRLLRGIVIFITVFGCLAFVSNLIQKNEERRDKQELSNQIKVLVNGSQTEATSADVTTVANAITIGFGRLEQIMSHGNIASQPSSVKPLAKSTAALPQSIRFTQKRVPTTDLQYPFAMQVIVQSDVSLSPVGLAVTFTGPISNIQFFLAGQPVTMMAQAFVEDENPKVGVIRVGSPALSPDTPMVISVLSKQNVNVVSIEKISAAMNGPLTPQ